jgi:hypothetical protein
VFGQARGLYQRHTGILPSSGTRGVIITFASESSQSAIRGGFVIVLAVETRLRCIEFT